MSKCVGVVSNGGRNVSYSHTYAHIHTGMSTTSAMLMQTGSEKKTPCAHSADSESVEVGSKDVQVAAGTGNKTRTGSDGDNVGGDKDRYEFEKVKLGSDNPMIQVSKAADVAEGATTNPSMEDNVKKVNAADGGIDILAYPRQQHYKNKDSSSQNPNDDEIATPSSRTSSSVPSVGDVTIAPSSLQMHQDNKSALPESLYTVQWSSEEQKVLEDTMRKFPTDKFTALHSYIQVAALLSHKGVRDVALRVRWMNRKVNINIYLQ